MYSAWEQRHRHDLRSEHRRDNLGLGENNADIQAMNAALAGPNGWMIQSHSSGSPAQLLGPVQALLEEKRAEAEHFRVKAQQYLAVKGPQDPDTKQAQEVALQTEAECRGVAAVERALENAQQLSLHATDEIAKIVKVHAEEKDAASHEWSDATGRYAQNDKRVEGARLNLLAAQSAWNGAVAAQHAPAQKGFEAATNPQDMANRRAAAVESYRAEAAQLRSQAEAAKRQYGAADPRVLEVQRQADIADANAQAVLAEANNVQRVADGGQAAATPGGAGDPAAGAGTEAKPKTKKKKQKSGGCF